MGKWTRLGLVAPGLILADQVTKLAILKWLAPVGNVKVIPGLFDLTFTLNSGVAFGILAGAPNSYRVLFLAGIQLLALAVIMVLIYQIEDKHRVLLWGLSLVSGGAAANVIDRIRLGGVVDFLDFYVGAYHWPFFNLADSGITVGTGLIMLHLWLNR